MNQIAWLEKNIAEVERLLAADREKAQRYPPGSIAHKLILKSGENRLLDLQNQLRIEKEDRDVEVIDLRLIGGQMDRGTIPLDVVSKLAREISEFIHSIAYRMQKGKDPRGTIPYKLQKTLDLRLAGVETGSTRLLITSKTNPNLFGQSLAEDSINAVFSVVNSKTDKDITDAVAAAGLRASRSISEMCNVLFKHKIQVEMKWDSPVGNDIVFKGNMSDLQNLSKSLNNLVKIPIETLNVDGTLSMASINGHFQVITDSNIYKGRYPDNILYKIKHLYLGSKVTAKIEKETIENKTTGHVKEVFRLVDIKKY